jgi:hypothetical protein
VIYVTTLFVALKAFAGLPYSSGRRNIYSHFFKLLVSFLFTS